MYFWKGNCIHIFRNLAKMRKLLDAFVNLIEKETVADNESKKMMVIIRVMSVTLMIFFVVSFLASVFCQMGYSTPINLLFILIFGIILYFSYISPRSVEVWLFIFGSVVWITLSLWLYGWFCGSQTFLLLLILVFYFSSYSSQIRKTLFSLLIFVVYMIMFLVFSNHTSVCELSEVMRILVRSAHMATLVICMSMLAYLFSRDSQSMEGKLIEYNRKLEEKASIDPLTGLYNRGKAVELLNALVDTSKYDTFSLCICDIDFFKKVNDNYGHDVGDEVLKMVAGVLTDIISGYGFAARWGGEEFMLVFPRTNGDDASTVVYAIQNAINKKVVTDGSEEIRITMTYGLTEYSPSITLDQNIKDADNKLYQGKDRGRNMVVY